MAQQSRFTSHIRTSDDDNLLALVVEQYIIWHIIFTKRQLLFDNRVATLLDVDNLRRVDNRADILVLLSHFSKAKQTIQTGYDVGVYLYLGDKLLHSHHKVVEEFGLQAQNLILSTKNLLFVLLQLLGDITLGLGQCLLANPLWRNKLLICVAHLKVIAEHIVISYLKALDTCFSSLALLNLQQIILT